MNNHESDFIKSMMKAALIHNVLEGAKKIDGRALMSGATEGSDIRRRFPEHHPSIQTAITDKDMLLLHIDMALDIENEELFKLLTAELRVMEALV